MNYGKLIVVDGIAGTGKTVLVNKIADELRKLSVSVLTVVGSGQTETTSDIRQIIMKSNQTYLEGKENIYIKLSNQFLRCDLQMANIWNSIVGHVIPALEMGSVVIMDRGIYSTLAHQGETAALFDYINRVWLAKLALVPKCFYEPDYLIALEVTAQVSLDRYKSRQANHTEDAKFRKLDTIGSLGLASKAAIIERYRQSFNLLPGKITIDLDMNDFEKLKMHEIETMIRHISHSFNMAQRHKLVNHV